MSGVFRNIDPPPPHRPRVCTPPPLVVKKMVKTLNKIIVCKNCPGANITGSLCVLYSIVRLARRRLWYKDPTSVSEVKFVKSTVAKFPDWGGGIKFTPV